MKETWWVFVLIFVVILAIGGFWLVQAKKRAGANATPTPTPEGVLLETALEDRPYVSLVPRADGRELKLTISRIKNAQTIEYELVYLSAGLSRGVIGNVKLAADQTTISRDLLLGSCSKNVCKYDEDVTEGTLTLRFRSPEGVRKFTADFNFQQGDNLLTSKDGQFQLEANLPASTYYLTMETIGLPADFEETPASPIYGVFSAGSQAIKAKVSITTDQPTAVYQWTRTGGWQVLTGAVSQLATFVAIASE